MGLTTASAPRPHARVPHTCAFFIGAFVILSITPLQGATLQRNTASRSEPELQKAVALAQAGRIAEADRAFAQIVASDPEDPRALTGLGQLQVQEGRVPESISTFRRVVVIDPNSAEAHVNLGIAQATHADFSAALAESETACRLAPASANAHFLKARILADLGRRAQARSEFEQVVVLAPTAAGAMTEWAALEGDDGHPVKQASLLWRYVALVPGDANAWFRLGQCLQAESRLDEAVKAYRRALQLNPEHAEAMYGLARTLGQRDPKEAHQVLRRVAALHDLKRVRDRINLLGNEANQAAADGQFEKAVDDLTEALQLCGECSLAGDLHKNLGLAYCRSGHLSAGERELKIAVGLNPQDEDIGRALAVAAQQQSAQKGP